MAKITTKIFAKTRNVAQPDDSDADYVPVDIDFPSANFSVGDIIELIEIPAGVKFCDWYAVFPDVDSNGSPAFAWSIGLLNAGSTDLTTVYSSGHTAGQTGSIARNLVSDPYLADSTVARRIGIKVTAAAATYAAPTQPGTVFVALRG